jgi:hypothetical protein
MANSDWLAKTTAGQIAAFTSKAQPVGGDYVMLNDSAATNAVKQCTLLALPSFEARRLPTMTYASAATITVAAAPGEPSTVYLTLQDGKRRSFSSTLTFNFANGAADLGLDEGSEASSTWYYMYLVPKSGDDTLLTLRASDNAPSTGPAGYTNFRYIGAFRNDGSSNILSFTQVGANKFSYAAKQTIYSGNGEVTNEASFTEVSIAAFVPGTASEVTISNFVSMPAESPTIPYWHIYWSGDGTNTADEWCMTGDTESGTAATLKCDIPLGATKSIWHKRYREWGSANLSWMAYDAMSWIDVSL